MIDYIKILIRNADIEHLKQNKQLNFIFGVCESTGECSHKMIAEYHFCKITIYESGLVLFTGSIHKLCNSINTIKAPNYPKGNYKGFNGNQFTLKDIFETRTHLESLFNCKPQQMVFKNIEFGVNTEPMFTPTQFIKGLLYHKNKLFEYRYENNFAQSVHQRYIFKIYNKSKQYGMKKHTLRIELKIVKTEELKALGIITFADIKQDTIDKAKQMLLKRFDELSYYDYTINKATLNNRTKSVLKNYSNPRYWIEYLKPIHRDRHKKRLKEIIAKHSQNLHFQISQEIEKKCVIINHAL